MKNLIKVGLVAAAIVMSANAWAQQCAGGGYVDAQGYCQGSAYGIHPYGSHSEDFSRPAPQQQSAYPTYNYPQPTRVPAGNFGAIAYGPGERRWRSVNYPNAKEAEIAALQGCGHKDCWAYAFVGGFAAIARQIKGKGLVAEWSDRGQKQAEAKAIQSCEKLSGKGKCRVVISGPARE